MVAEEALKFEAEKVRLLEEAEDSKREAVKAAVKQKLAAQKK